MPTATSILTDLKKRGTEQARKTYARHGMPPERTFGVSVADMKTIAKTIKGQQALACELYGSGMMEAMYLAGMVADGSLMTKKELTGWAEAGDLSMISGTTVPWVALDSPLARDIAIEWMKSKKEHVAVAGWNTYTGLLATKPNDELDLAEIEQLIASVASGIHKAKNRVRYAMNGFLIAVGTYIAPLTKQARAAAKHIGVVMVDMGDTACEVPNVIAAIEKVERAGKLGKKRKTMRC